jgi:hypothetical protein
MQIIFQLDLTEINNIDITNIIEFITLYFAITSKYGVSYQDESEKLLNYYFGIIDYIV